MVNHAQIEAEYARLAGALKREDVRALLDWCALQPHLPPVSELLAAMFLHTCAGSNEAAKQCIDLHYTCKTHCPEFFAARDPAGKEVQRALDTTALMAMPTMTPDGHLVFYARLLDVNPDNYSLTNSLKAFDMLGEQKMREHGCVNGGVIIIDLLGATLTHVLKSNPLAIKKYLFYLQDALPMRLRSFHFVNAVPFMDKILALVKPFIKKELQEHLYVHYGDNASIYKLVPKSCLPKDIGGECASVAEIHAKCRAGLEEHAEFFLEEEKHRVDESKRPGKPRDAGELFGVEGTFKKLEID